MDLTLIEKNLFCLIYERSRFRPEEALEIYEGSNLTKNDFSLAVGDLWELMGQTLRNSQALDVLLLEEKGRASKALSQHKGLIATYLMGVPPNKKSWREYADVIALESLRRRTLEGMRQIASTLKERRTSMEDVISQGQELFASLLTQAPQMKSVDAGLLAYLDEADAAMRNEREFCISTGIEGLDLRIGGLQASVLTLIGALPGVGKSALLATIAYNLAKRGVRVGFFSLEDDHKWLAKRFVAYESKISLFNVNTYKLNTQQRESMQDTAADVFENGRNIIVDDRPGLSASDIVMSASRMVSEHKCKVIIVDHLGEVRMERSERYDLDVADALSAFRNFAKRYALPVVVASHVKRRAGLNIEDAPYLTDFANSSAPERMARVALGLSKAPGGMRVSVLKQTNGPSGDEIGLKMTHDSALIESIGELPLPTKM